MYSPTSYFPLTILHPYVTTHLLFPTYDLTSLHTHLPPTSHLAFEISTYLSTYLPTYLPPMDYKLTIYLPMYLLSILQPTY
jgi:hypothetical protein